MSLYIRGDWHVCPNPLSLDTYNMCQKDCAFCFVKQLEEGWLKKKTERGLRSYPTNKLEKQLKLAFSTERETKNPIILALRADLPVIVGRKCEPFCLAEKDHRATESALEMLADYAVKVIVETRMVDEVLEYILPLDTECGVNISILFGDEKVRNMMEPETSPYEERWALAKKLREAGIHVGMIAEPLIPTINDREEFYHDYSQRASETGVNHVNFGELRVSNVKIAAKRFKKVGADLVKIARGKNNWVSEAEKIFTIFEEEKVPVSTPDWVNFRSRNSCEGCCGLDPFGVHHFTFQKAHEHLTKYSTVTWQDIERYNIFGEKYSERFREIWNGKKRYYNLCDVEKLSKVGYDENRDVIYGKPKSLTEVFG